MRYFFCFIVLFVSVFRVNAQNIQVISDSYYVKDKKYYLSTINVTNDTKDTMIMWFSECWTTEDTMDNIRFRFFSHTGGDFGSLGQFLYDSNVLTILNIEVTEEFFKELPPTASFNIIFFDTSKVLKAQSMNFYQDHVVMVKKDMLSSFHFTEMPTWQLLLYKNDFIILPKRMLTY